MTDRKSPNTIASLLLITLFGLLGGGCACCSLFSAIQPEEALETSPRGPTLTVAFSPEKEALFSQLVKQFNAQGFETPMASGW
jgi:hypothetical protein